MLTGDNVTLQPGRPGTLKTHKVISDAAAASVFLWLQMLRKWSVCVCEREREKREGGWNKWVTHPPTWKESLNKVVLEGKRDGVCDDERDWNSFSNSELRFQSPRYQLYVSCWYTLFSSSLFCPKWFRSVCTDGHRTVSGPGDTDLNPVSANGRSADVSDTVGSWDAALLTSDLAGMQTELRHLILNFFF